MKMKYILTVVIGVLLVANALAQICMNAVFDLTETQQEELKAKAEMGDKDAAYRMWEYHLLWTNNKSEANKWLERAASLDHAEAQRWLAHLIVTYGHPYKRFGDTPQEAVLALLMKASRTNGQAALELGEAYKNGYFGPGDDTVKAREALQIASEHQNRSSWELLARMLHEGQGGVPDQRTAYYLICLATRCTHPDSISGKELWELRRSIERELGLSEIKETWAQVDSYIVRERKYQDGGIYPPPLMGTTIPENKWKSHVKRTDEFEMQQRKELITARGKQEPSEVPAEVDGS